MLDFQPILTGGASGIALAKAKALAGRLVALWDLNETKAQGEAAECRPNRQ